jgi:hypothetical protein
VLLAAAPLPVGVLVGAASGEGVTEVPPEESASPIADTPGPAALGPTLIAVAGAGAFAEVAGDEAIPLEAGGVPVGGGEGESDVAGVVPDGVRISEVAVAGAAPIAVVALALAVVLVPVDVPM